MLTVSLAKLLAALTIASAAAQTTYNDKTYTVWASVVVNRIGERSPEILNDHAPVLTTTGAQQMYSAGSFFRNRYLAANGSSKIFGMSQSLLDASQLYVQAFDSQPGLASAQAFLQGFYPPTTPSSTSANLLDPTSIYNSSYVAAPFNGYQYSQVHSTSIYDPQHIYIDGVADCPAFDLSSQISGSNTQYLAIQNTTRAMYQRLAPLLSKVVVAQALDFANAYALYDYISYHVAHDASFAQSLTSYTGGMAVGPFLDNLRWLADEEQQFELANMTALNVVLNNNTLPLSTPGSISTIAGNFLAAKILVNLQTSVQTQGQYYKLSTLFTDYEPLVSLFALMDLAETESNAPSNFTGLPAYASSAAFELYSWANTSNNSYPSLDDLYVSFHFRNGTDPSDQFYSYPAFRRGRSQTDMSWTDFSNLMSVIMLNDPGVWCTQCAAANLFCAAWNSTLSSMIADGDFQAQVASSSTTPTSTARGLSPAAAGAIGAVVALAVGALIFALVMLLGGIRFHRRTSRKTSELGGFKGSSKMASDRDLVLPPQHSVGADESGFRPGAHERSGSWELKGQEKQDAVAPAMPTHQERQRARDDEDEDLRVNPFANPVQARESF